jgi:hypothetical protein
MLEGYHHSLPSSAKCMLDNFNFCNYMYKKYLFRSVNCVHMIYIIYQHNQVNKWGERWNCCHIYHMTAYKTIYLRLKHTRYLPFLDYCTKVIYIKTNTKNEHAQYTLFPGTRKNADMTTHPVESLEVISKHGIIYFGLFIKLVTKLFYLCLRAI